ncbi:MAG: GNAT family N-acetyltransferase [Kofleriaceae bacterium]|jgi:hypothetical protein|nr:GNAT family N-acetyltransferase [Kofleriaceae bacterium]
MSAAAATELLARVADEPRWVEARALVLALAAGTPGVDAVRCASGWLVRAPADGLAVAIGVAPASALAALGGGAAAAPMAVLLPDVGASAADTAEVTAAAAAVGRRAERAVVHTLGDADDAGDALPDDDGVGLLPAEAALDHVPAPLRAELVRARSRGPVVAAQVDGVAVSFAYAPWRSTRWFDISVDTLPGLRQRGLGTRVAAGLIRLERAAADGAPRRQPVWGADEDNRASRALAARLGFVAVDHLWLVP